MELNINGIKDRAAWEAKGYSLPSFERERAFENAKKAPLWIHFGAGNIFRAYHAALAQDMLEKGACDTGLIVAEGFDYEIVEKMYKPHDNLGVMVTLKSDGSIEKKVIGSIASSLVLDRENSEDFNSLKAIFENPSLQMATFTITEKGYGVKNGAGELLPAIAADIEKGPFMADSYLGKVCSLLYYRFKKNQAPLAMVSTDNCSHNGDKLRAAMVTIAEGWKANGKAEEEFLAYIEGKISYPWSMIDKITPRPDAKVREMLAADEIGDLKEVVTSKNTWVAPFVNAEECQYLVIQDDFPNGRPALEKAGVIFTDRETVDKVEKMKVCTCLNPLHTALAVFGCLLGYTLISAEMKDAQLKKLVERIGYTEGLPVVVDPGIIRPKDFIDEVLQKRIPNPFMPDAPQRIATDTSQKLPIRYGETIKAYMAAEDLDENFLECIPLVQAGWLRYLMGINDEGENFEISPDPMLEELKPLMDRVSLGQGEEALEVIRRIICREDIFGLDLTKTVLGPKVEKYFLKLIEGKGSVRKTLTEAVGK